MGCKLGMMLAFCMSMALGEMALGQEKKATTTAPGTVVASVGGRKLTHGDLEAMKKFLSAPSVDNDRLIGMWKLRAGLANVADREKFTQDPEVRSALRIVCDQMMVSMFLQYKQKNVTVTDREIKDYYAKNQDRREFREPEILSVRFLAVEKKEKADEVKKQLVAGANFDTLRGEYRDETLKTTGLSDTEIKQVSVVQLSRSLGPVALAMTRAGINEVVGPRQVNQGWILFKVTDRKPGNLMPLEKVSPEIKAEVMRKKQSGVQNALIKEAEKESGVSMESLQRPNSGAGRPLFRKGVPRSQPAKPLKK